MRFIKTASRTLAVGVLALTLLTSCGGAGGPSPIPGGDSSGNSGNSCVSNTPNGTGGNTTTSKPSSPSSSSSDNETKEDPNAKLEAYQKEVLRLVNEARSKRGLSPVGMENDGLTAMAQEHAETMPNTYAYCNELVLMGHKTPSEVVDVLCQKNFIYGEDTTQLGIGFYYNENSTYRYYWSILTGDQYFPMKTAAQRETYQQEVLAELNQLRAEKNLPPMKLDASLTKAAQQCADDPEGNHVFSSEFVSKSRITQSASPILPKDFVQDIISCCGSYLNVASCDIIGIGITSDLPDRLSYAACALIGKSSSDSSSETTPLPGTSDREDGENSSSLDQVSEKTEVYRQEVLRLVNIERQKNDLEPLSMSSANLTRAAQRRANELVIQYSHQRPDGRDCFTVLPEYQVFSCMAAENIAMGQTSPYEVVNDWMNSPGHRQNILNPNYHKIGIGVYADPYGRYYWVQLFTN